MTKIVYAYNAENDNVFTGEHVCQPNPKRPGEFLTPSNYSETDPGKIPPNKNAFYDAVKKRWEFRDDYRGTAIYDTTTGQRTTCREFKIPAGFTSTPPGKDEMWNGSKWVADPEKIKISTIAAAKDELTQIDLQSIRAIREWLVTQPNAPTILKQYEDDAKAERAKLK